MLWVFDGTQAKYDMSHVCNLIRGWDCYIALIMAATLPFHVDCSIQAVNS